MITLDGQERLARAEVPIATAISYEYNLGVAAATGINVAYHVVI
jgi:hypothetical protein